MSPPVFLIGYRGTGKSTVAGLLARELGVEAVDSDTLIEQRSGCPIADLFARDGEPAFRAIEAQVVAELCLRDNIVGALGGGAILDPESRSRLAESGLVVWLTATPTVLAERLSIDAATASQRPSLTGRGVVEEIESVLAERLPLYRECADLEVDTAGRTPEDVVSRIVELFSADMSQST